jgi:hypothetical protein
MVPAIIMDFRAAGVLSLNRETGTAAVPASAA